VKIHGWILRLQEEFPTWKVWVSSPGGWFAVIAPEGTDVLTARQLPGVLNARTPQLLRNEMKEIQSECS
jgi:hypothetical protein